MFRHIVLLTLADNAPAGTTDSIVEALRKLPAQIPVLRDYRVGSDVGLAADNATIGVVADFDDEAGYLVYRDHSAHVGVIDELIRPFLAQRCAVQMETPPTPSGR